MTSRPTSSAAVAVLSLLALLSRSCPTDAVRGGFRGTRTLETAPNDADAVVDGSSGHRHLMEHAHFSPLSCNSDLSTADCSTSFATLIPSSDNDDGTPIVVPCGECYTMDLQMPLQTLTLQSGLDIQGKLVFPPDYKLTLYTPFVYVQGVLQITSNRPTSGTEDVKFILTGTDETLTAFVPHTENAMACGGMGGMGGTMGMSCGVGIKPIVVAGGTLDIQGLAPSVPTWKKLKNVVTIAGPADASDIPSAIDPPSGCTSHLIDANFDLLDGTSTTSTDLSKSGWHPNYADANSFKSWDGTNTVVASVTDLNSQTGAGNTYAMFTNRRSSWNGPQYYVDPNCVVTGATYFLSAKVRLTKADGTPSNCATSTNGSGCLKIILKTDYTDRGPTYNNKGSTSSAQPDGEWVNFLTKFTFDETSNIVSKRKFYFEGPEAGVDIAIDDVQMFLAPEEAFPDPEAPNGGVCADLITNGEVDAMGLFPHPFFPLSGTQELEVKQEDDGLGGVNNYLAVSNRRYDWDTPGYYLLTDCIASGAVYSLSIKIRVHSAAPKTFRFQMTVEQPEGGSGDTSWPWLFTCPPQSAEDGWVTCSGDYTFDDAEGRASSVKIYMVSSDQPDPADNVDDDVDFDSFSVTFKSGPVTGLVVSDPDEFIAQYWGAGSEVLLTSHSLDYQDSSVSTIDAVTSNGDGTSTIKLVGAVGTTSFEDDEPDFAAEVALLSRNIVFEGADDGNEYEGGHLIVYHTPHVAQKIDGVEVRKFGQQGKLGKYPIHVHMSGSVDGTVISRNTIRQSHQRCVVIHGSHNATVDSNVAYDTFGHCYILEDGAEMDNTISNNLGALTKKAITIISDDETDDEPATFWLTNPINDVYGNVAAGSAHSGFWWEMRTHVRGPSASMHQGVNPSELPLTSFRDNVAHSNWEHGIKTYPGAGYKPESADQAVFADCKSYRNRGDGVFIHNSRNIAIEGGVYADNRIQIDIDRSPTCRVQGTQVIGYSPEYRAIVESSPAWSHCPSGWPLHGVQLHTYWSGGSKWRQTDVIETHFANLGDETGCPGSVAISIDQEQKGYFDVRTTVSGLTFDAGTAKFSTCDATAAGIEDVAIHDLDGSIMGSQGYVVSNSDRMTTFQSGCSVDAASCAVFCPDTCYRTMAIGTTNLIGDDLHMEITDKGTGETAVISGFYDSPLDMDDDTLNMDEHLKVWRRRKFYAKLPAAGDYTAKFVLNGDDYWPIFAETQYEDLPGPCGDDFNSFDLIVPQDQDCSQLILNGNMEDGIADWWVNGGTVTTSDQSASGQGVALLNSVRGGTWNGIGQFLDTRCMVEGTEYTFTAKVKTVNANGDQWSCDTSASWEDSECPKATLKSQQGSSDLHSETWTSAGSTSESANEWNTISGTIQVTSAQASAGSVLLWFEGPPAGINVIIDDVSVVPKGSASPTPSPTCGSLFEDDFEGGSGVGWPNGWYANYADTNDAAEATSVGSHAEGDTYVVFKNRYQVWHGPQHELDISCMVPGKPYQISLKARLTKDGSTSNCALDGTNCLKINFYKKDKDLEYPDDASKDIESWSVRGEAGQHDDGEWFDFSFITEFDDSDVDMSNFLIRRFYFEGPEAGVDIAIDDLSIVELASLPPTSAPTCSPSVLDDDFENGSSMGWPNEWYRNYEGSDEISNTADDTYAVFQGRTVDWHGPQKNIDVSCIEAGVPYVISYKARLSKAGGTSNCDLTGSNCLGLTLYTEDDNPFRQNWYGFGNAGQQTDGEWFDFTTTYTFSAEVLDTTNVKARRVFFNGPEEGVEIAIDNVKITKA